MFEKAVKFVQSWECSQQNLKDLENPKELDAIRTLSKKNHGNDDGKNPTSNSSAHNSPNNSQSVSNNSNNRNQSNRGKFNRNHTNKNDNNRDNNKSDNNKSYKKNYDCKISASFIGI